VPRQGSYQVTIRPTDRCAPGTARPGRQLNASARHPAVRAKSVSRGQTESNSTGNDILDECRRRRRPIPPRSACTDSRFGRFSSTSFTIDTSCGAGASLLLRRRLRRARPASLPFDNVLSGDELFVRWGKRWSSVAVRTERLQRKIENGLSLLWTTGLRSLALGRASR
jgi:hypothetical protein